MEVWKTWNFQHQPPNASFPRSSFGANVMPDLASAMKYNPNLKILLHGGYFDLATPYCEGQYEMGHLQIPDEPAEPTSISLLTNPATWSMHMNLPLRNCTTTWRLSSARRTT